MVTWRGLNNFYAIGLPNIQMGAIVPSYYLFIGQLVDPKNQKNLTEKRLIEFNKIDVKQLPLEQAIRYVKGDVKRTLYIFTDPDCPYCQKLE